MILSYKEKLNMKEIPQPVNTSETKFLVTFFDKLNYNKITYAVLRNYKYLPYDLKGSDIDLFVCEDDFKKFHKILKETAEQFNGYEISILRTPTVKDVSVSGFYDNEWWGVRFDTFTYIGTNECSIFANNYITDRIEYHNSLKVVSKNDADVLGFIKELIGAKKYSKRYSEGALKAYVNAQEQYYKAFCETLPIDIVTSYLIPLLKDELLFSEKICFIIYNGYKSKSLKNGIKSDLLNAISNYKYKLKRLVDTPGFSIAILGTDGSGKTTIINSLIPLLEKPLHNKIVYSHMRPNMLPNIAQLFGKPKVEGPNTKPHNGQVSGVIISALRLLYYSFDYIIGYWIIVNTTLAKKTTIWFFDRYYYDYLIDQKRASINLPIWVIKFIGIFIPKPDLILCLGTDPNLIHSRKPELPLNEVKIQVMKLKEFCLEKDNAVWVDTGNKSIESTVDYAMNQIIINMANRYKNKS